MLVLAHLTCFGVGEFGLGLGFFRPVAHTAILFVCFVYIP